MTAPRSARARDRSELIELYRAYFAEEGVPAPASLAGNLFRMLSDERAFFRVVEEGGRLVGLVSATASHGVEFGASVAIETLYVVPAARRRGHAGRLMQSALEHADAIGAGQVILVVGDRAETPDGLAAFCRRFGFADSGRRLLYRR